MVLVRYNDIKNIMRIRFNIHFIYCKIVKKYALIYNIDGLYLFTKFNNNNNKSLYLNTQNKRLSLYIKYTTIRLLQGIRI